MLILVLDRTRYSLTASSLSAHYFATDRHNPRHICISVYAIVSRDKTTHTIEVIINSDISVVDIVSSIGERESCLLN